MSEDKLLTLAQKIEQTEAALAAADLGFRKAANDIAANGLSTLRTIKHAHREFSEMRPNPSIRILAAADATRRILRRDLQRLRTELAEVTKQATPSRWSKFAPKARENDIQ